MKHTWLGAALAALLLSGCSIYGNESARVVDRNVAYGQSGNFGGQGGLQPQQPQQGGFNFNGGYANAGQAVPPPVNPAYANNQPLRPQMGQPPVNTPTVPNVPPPVQQTQVQAANPYQPAAPNIAKTPAPAPGWGAPADQPKVTPAPNANQPAAPTPSPAVAELTPRETVILRLIALGLTNQEIADHEYVSMATVKTHVRHILMKTNSRDRVHAVLFAYRTGVVSTDELLSGGQV